MIRSVLFSALALFVQTSSQAADQTPTKPLVIAHVTVIDTSGGPSMADMTVVVTGDRITALEKSEHLTASKDAAVIDGTGKFLIPGLWDMHVHGINPALLLSNGVTGVRLMWGGPRTLENRGEFDKGTRLGPRMVACGNILDGPKPVRDATLKIATAAEGRQAVRDSKNDGYDFIKVYSLLHREPFLAIVDEAKKQGLPVAGHVPEFVSVVEASDAGLKCMEHLNGILPACSRLEVELRNELTETMMKPEVPAAAVYSLRQAQTKRLLATYSDEKAKALFARLAKNGTWQCPTFTVLRAVGYLDDPEFTNDTRLKYVPPQRREGWKPENDFRLKTWTMEDYGQQRARFHKELELVGAMHRAGVPILAGTDAGNPYCFQGFSLHDELELLVKAGLTPMQALQTATLNPARFLEREKDLGTVDQGKLADLLLLDADPLTDIKNTQKIAAVVVGGRLLDRARLDSLLAEAEADAQPKDGPAPVQPQPPRRDQWQSEVYIMNIDGSGLRNLTNHPAEDGEPEFSPDRKRLVFDSNRNGNFDLFVINIDGSNLVQLTDSPAKEDHGTWSPDGKFIAYQHDAGDNTEVYLMNADGSQKTRLTTDMARDGWPGWSPDGQQIVFSSERDGHREIYVMNRDGSEQRRLTNCDRNNTDPAWSPDGKWIAFNSERDGNSEIYIMRPDGTKQTRITQSPSFDQRPCWSPDSRHIAFGSESKGRLAVMVIGIDDSEAKEHSPSGKQQGRPSWSPDGRLLLVQQLD